MYAYLGINNILLILESLGVNFFFFLFCYSFSFLFLFERIILKNPFRNYIL